MRSVVVLCIYYPVTWGWSKKLLQGIVTAPILFAMEEFPQLRTIVDEGFENPANVDLVS